MINLIAGVILIIFKHNLGWLLILLSLFSCNISVKY